MWSMPPADPPAQLTRSGSARRSPTRSARVWWGEPAGTAITSYSSSSRASGTVSSIETGERLVRMDPSMTCPNTITVCGSPRWRVTRSASPMVPPAPPRLTTSTGTPRMPASVHTCCIWRAVWSQPPPGLAGASRVSAPWGNPADVGASAFAGRSVVTPPPQEASIAVQRAMAQSRQGPALSPAARGPGGGLRRACSGSGQHAVADSVGTSALYQDRSRSTPPICPRRPPRPAARRVGRDGPRSAATGAAGRPRGRIDLRRNPAWARSHPGTRETRRVRGGRNAPFTRTV